MGACCLFKNHSMHQTTNWDFVLNPEIIGNLAVVISSARVCCFGAQDEISKFFSVAIEIAAPTTNSFLVVPGRHIKRAMHWTDHRDGLMGASVGNQAVVVPGAMDLLELLDYLILGQFSWHAAFQFMKKASRYLLHRRQQGYSEQRPHEKTKRSASSKRKNPPTSPPVKAVRSGDRQFRLSCRAAPVTGPAHATCRSSSLRCSPGSRHQTATTGSRAPRRAACSGSLRPGRRALATRYR